MTAILQPLGLGLLFMSAGYWLLTGTESTLFVVAACLLIVLGRAAAVHADLRGRTR